MTQVMIVPVISTYLPLHTQPHLLLEADHGWSELIYPIHFNVFLPFVNFYREMISMTNHNPARVVLMLVGFFTCLAAIMFNLLSGYGEKSGEDCLRGFWSSEGFQKR